MRAMPDKQVLRSQQKRGSMMDLTTIVSAGLVYLVFMFLVHHAFKKFFHFIFFITFILFALGVAYITLNGF